MIITVEAAGLHFQPHDITYKVPISLNQFDALLHCDVDEGSGITGLWNHVLSTTPISHIDYHLADAGPHIHFSIPTDKHEDDIFATISTALWATLDACVAELDRAEAEEDAFQ